MNRRRVLVGLTAGLSSLAGCGTYFDIDGNNTTTSLPTTTTATETARTTAANTPVPTATATPPLTAELPTGTESETAPDLSARETYTNDRYGYTIEHPTGWTIDATDPAAVTIGSNRGAVLVEVTEDVPSSLTVADIVPVFVEGYKDSIEEKGGAIEELDRRDESRPNGHDAAVIDLRIEQNAAVIRQKMLLTVANEMAYVAVVMVPDPVFTTGVGESMETILLTLRIAESVIETESAGVPV